MGCLILTMRQQILTWAVAKVANPFVNQNELGKHTNSLIMQHPLLENVFL